MRFSRNTSRYTVKSALADEPPYVLYRIMSYGGVPIMVTRDEAERWEGAASAYAKILAEAADALRVDVRWERGAYLRLLPGGHRRVARKVAALEDRYRDVTRAATATYAPIRNLVEARIKSQQKAERRHQQEQEKQRAHFRSLAEQEVWGYLVEAANPETVHIFWHDVQPTQPRPTSSRRSETPLSAIQLDAELRHLMTEQSIKLLAWDPASREHAARIYGLALSDFWQRHVGSDLATPRKADEDRSAKHPSPSRSTGTSHHSSHGIGGHY
ncbi:hypothetical protein [Plantactinospora soyae]|uniref:Uncharacterized protein n=1 Tax=Plantactinospora soyae TaxID=1544732 RepID=A0A927M6L8_9ACTN|nr:hypothetical protein [Plantactinospora soyae]MBE1487691.1 hypothetical protein [Plantactinospora soyae]